MSLADLNQTLEACADPVLLYDGLGSLLWQNTASARFSSSGIASAMSPEHLKEILRTDHYRCLDLSIPRPEGGDIRFSAIVIEVGSGDPDNSRFLVTLKTFASQETQLVEKEEFLATVAHDLKNPVGAIFGYADTLLDTTLGQGMTPAQQQVARRIRGTASRAIDLIRNYQLLSQLRIRGYLRPQTSIDLNEIVRNSLEHTWREDGACATLTTTLFESPLPVLMERIAAERVISNLISNALKYTPTNGSIEVATGRESDRPTFTIRNTGVQIRSEEIPLIFERYRRTSSSEGTSGSGLGLYIVKTLMNAAGGSISVESSPESGVKFKLVFPCTKH